MSILYREKDQSLYREYSLTPEGQIISFQGDHALLDVVDTKEYGPMFFLDGVLQASAVDEYIYHEFLVHPAMAYAKENKMVCILGGGDGCAAREILKWKSTHVVDLYDWDKKLVGYFREHGKLWNQGSLKDPKVNYQHTDIATQFSSSETERYDVILVDLLDPEYKDLEKENGFWIHLLNLVGRWRKHGGSIVINGGGVTPWQNGCFSLLQKLCRSMFPDLFVILYKVFVPSFAREWAFILIVERNSTPKELPYMLRRFTFETFKRSFLWEPDFKIDK
jgi:spermidine synthase